MFSLSAFPAPGADRPPPDAGVDRQTRTFVVVASNNFPPINFLDGKGDLTGFARDISTAVAKAVGVDTVYLHSSQYSEVLKRLETGKADLIHDTAYSEERALFLDFTDPILEMQEVIFTRSDQVNITGFGSLRGKSVAAVRQHISHLYLEKYPEIHLRVVGTPTEAFYLLVHGDVDAFVYPKQVVAYMAQELRLGDKIKVVGNPLRILRWSMVVKKGNKEVLDLLNEGIRKIRASGEYDRIYDRWFGKRLLAGYSKKEVGIITAIAVGLSLLIGITASLLVMNVTLRKTKNQLSETVSELQSAETKISKTLLFMQVILDAIPAPVFYKDARGFFLGCNKAYEEYIGIPRDRLVGMTVYDIAPKDLADVYRDADDALFRKGGAQVYETGMVPADGKRHDVIFNKATFPNPDGSLGGLVGTILDITERKRAEDALKESEEKFRLIFDNASDGILLADAESLKFEMANRKFCEMLGYSEEEIPCLRVLDLHHEKDLPAVLAGFQEAKGGVRIETDVPMKKKDGSVFFADIATSLVAFEGKGFLLGIFRDRTHERMLQQQLHAAQKMEALGTLAGGIAHDFNNLLTVVLGHAEFALKDIPPMSPAHWNLTEITTAARRAADLSLQMLTYAGKAVFTVERVGLRDLVDEMAPLLRTAISKKAILNLNLERGLPPIQADLGQIRQIVMNLIINASEAIGDRSGVITVSVGATRCDEEYLYKTELHDDLAAGLYVHLEVTDTGSGMDAKTRSRIFEPFFSTKFTGRGLGLAAVQGIVRAHKGALKLDSEPGKGTTFRILFPAMEAAGEGVWTSKSSPLADWRGKGTILLVDDEESLIALGARMLEHLGFGVLTAADGLQAVDLYRERGKEIDLVLMDLTMPHMDGAEACGELRRLNPDVRVVLVSGYSHEDVAARVAGKGIDGVLQKPYTLAKLREALAGVLPKRLDGEE